ncbi:unnamed protein product [Closterium sp. NIES-54]
MPAGTPKGPGPEGVGVCDWAWQLAGIPPLPLGLRSAVLRVLLNACLFPACFPVRSSEWLPLVQPVAPGRSALSARPGPVARLERGPMTAPTLRISVGIWFRSEADPCLWGSLRVRGPSRAPLQRLWRTGSIRLVIVHRQPATVSGRAAETIVTLTHGRRGRRDHRGHLVRLDAWRHGTIPVTAARIATILPLPAPLVRDRLLAMRLDIGPRLHVLPLLRFEMELCTPVATPLPLQHLLTAPAVPTPEACSEPYPELVGSLMYAMMCTRPDLAYPVNVLSRYVAPGRFTDLHWKAAKRVLRYLQATKSHVLTLGGLSLSRLEGYTDSSWADDQTDRRSSQGYCFTLGSGIVSWRSTRSSAVSLSSCEAELYAGTMAAQEARWLTFLLQELGFPQSAPTLWCDNQSTIHISQDPVYHTRTKHIELRHFFIRDLVQQERLKVEYVASDCNLADLFTKPLGKVPHHRLLGAMGLCAPPSLPWCSHLVVLKSFVPPLGTRSPVHPQLRVLRDVLLLVASRLTMVIAGDPWPSPKPAAAVSAVSGRSPPVSASGSAAMKPPVPPAPKPAPSVAGVSAPPNPDLVSCEAPVSLLPAPPAPVAEPGPPAPVAGPASSAPAGPLLSL